MVNKSETPYFPYHHSLLPQDELEKGCATVTVQSGSTDSDPLKETQKWIPGFWSQFPWLGIGALLGVIVCSAASVIVIYRSDGKARSKWKVQMVQIEPNVVLNIFASMASILVTMAVGQGITIAWWRKALKGATLEDLHHSWSFSSSKTSILTKYKFFNIMALTALCTKLVIVDSTLFQKATSTMTHLGKPSQIFTEVFPVAKFPVTGQLNQFGNETSLMTYAMTWDAELWQQSSQGVVDLNGFYGCENLCNLSYSGIGFESTCTMTNITANRSESTVSSGNANDNLLLDINFVQNWPTTEKNYSSITMNWVSWSSNSSLLGSNPSCVGHLVNLTCELRPAAITYPITIQNTSYSYRDSKETYNNYMVYLGTMNTTGGYYEGQFPMDDWRTNKQVPNFTIVDYIDVLELQEPGGNTSIGGIVMALNTYYQSHSTVSYEPETFSDPTTDHNTTTTRPVLTPTGLFATFSQHQDYKDGCPIGYDVAYDYMLYQINLLTLIISDDLFARDNYTGDLADYYAWSGNYYSNYTFDAAVSVTTTQLKDEIYFVSTMSFAWGAFASTLFVVVLILPSYWGFWQLGRKVTLSPLEIANAFQGTVFRRASTGDGHVDTVIKAVGKQKVQYSVYTHDQFGVKYGFEAASVV